MNPYLAASPTAAQFAAMQSAGGPHMFSQQAMMMAAAAQQPSAASLMRARELAQFEAASMAASGMNPMFLGGGEGWEFEVL